jgi:pectate lyase
MKLSLTVGILNLAGALAVTTTLPKSAGVSSVPTAIPVKKSYDGGLKRFERNRKFGMAGFI